VNLEIVNDAISVLKLVVVADGFALDGLQQDWLDLGVALRRDEVLDEPAFDIFAARRRARRRCWN